MYGRIQTPYGSMTITSFSIRLSLARLHAGVCRQCARALMYVSFESKVGLPMVGAGSAYADEIQAVMTPIIFYLIAGIPDDSFGGSPDSSRTTGLEVSARDILPALAVTYRSTFHRAHVARFLVDGNSRRRQT